MSAENRPTQDQAAPVYAVGIDLGTTHCVIAHTELNEEDRSDSEVLAIAQLTKPGQIEDRYQLPSFLYQAHEAALAKDDRALPWDDVA